MGGTIGAIFNQRPVDPLDPRNMIIMDPWGNPRPNPAASPAGAPPIASSPAHPEVPPSSTLDQIMSTSRAGVDTARQQLSSLGAGPGRVEPDKWTKLASIIAAGAEGFAARNPASGVRTAQNILEQPTLEARQQWEDKYKTAQRGYEDALQNFNIDLSQKREADEAAHRTKMEGFESEKLGLEKTRTEQSARAEQDRMQMERDRLNRPQNEVELAIAMHKTGPDGNPTPDALQAKQAFLDIQRQRLDQIHATKNPNEQAVLLKDLQTNYVQMRGQLEREATAIEGNIMAKNDPAMQSQLKGLRQSILGIDKDLEHVNGEIRKRIGGGMADSTSAAPISEFKGSQNFTVSAPGKPAVQKSLTYQQVQQLQQAGIQLSPVKTAPKK